MDGTRIAPSDNSPAWVVHALLMGNNRSHPLQLDSWADFNTLMCSKIATHMFDVPKCVAWSANSFGWYVAHILPAKNRNTAWRNWSRPEVARRFFRTLHPCNLFFVPGVRNRELGESTSVIAHILMRFSERYGSDFWQDFVRRSTGELTPAAQLPASDGSLLVRLGEPKPRPVRPQKVTNSKPTDLAQGTVRYSASRLTFKRDVIEPLAEDEAFEVETPFGTFRFTKRQFYEDFPNIPRTESYRSLGIYHGAKLHQKALHRRIRV